MKRNGYEMDVEDIRLLVRMAVAKGMIERSYGEPFSKINEIADKVMRDFGPQE